jgi:ribosome-associated toxin RatA of RatAB toxin-antitoxin module|uniref:Uncharacterized protein n=1 Tax=Siphoviridae sp. ctGuJ10 TaxID=2825418 RepID=A0A8S5PSI2_9CAUD|nr:MAG TPA: protein of unknown function (DUF4969) [Siphoviridae sp. ctGuJ10]
MKRIVKIALLLCVSISLIACSQSKEDKEFTAYKSIAEKILDKYISDYKTSFDHDDWSIAKQENDITVISSKIEYKGEKPLFTIIITDMVKEDDIKFITHFVKVGKETFFDDKTIE